MKSIYLEDYKPKSKLKVKSHKIKKAKFPTIDFHGHFADFYCDVHTRGENWEKPDIAKVVEKFKEQNIHKVVNLDGFFDGFYGLSQEDIFRPFEDYMDFFITFVSVNTELVKLGGDAFEKHVIDHLTRAKEWGAKGVKLFKNVSLTVMESPWDFVPGRNIAIDDERLKPLWDTAAKLDLPILVHIADPEAFFDPVDEYNERYLELRDHPDWFYYGSGTYSFEELMEAQKNLLANNPDTTFVVAHVGSNAENLAFVGECLDNYSNMYIDIAARINELGRQPYTSRDFFIKYQDRIVFGTDVFTQNLDYIYEENFRFLETFDEYISGGMWPTYGIGLEDDILKKIYYDNAAKLLKDI